MDVEQTRQDSLGTSLARHHWHLILIHTGRADCCHIVVDTSVLAAAACCSYRPVRLFVLVSIAVLSTTLHCGDRPAAAAAGWPLFAVHRRK